MIARKKRRRPLAVGLGWLGSTLGGLVLAGAPWWALVALGAFGVFCALVRTVMPHRSKHKFALWRAWRRERSRRRRERLRARRQRRRRRLRARRQRSRDQRRTNFAALLGRRPARPAVTAPTPPRPRTAHRVISIVAACAAPEPPAAVRKMPG